MKTSDWLMLLAVLLSPLIAVEVQRWIERHRRRQDQKIWVFQTLMATRAARVSPEHVRALNMIDVTFYGRRLFFMSLRSGSETRVLAAWKEYLDQLNAHSGANNQDAFQRWATRGDELFSNLLYTMGKDLGYSFDRMQLMRNIYVPIAQGTLEAEFNE